MKKGGQIVWDRENKIDHVGWKLAALSFIFFIDEEVT